MPWRVLVDRLLTGLNVDDAKAAQGQSDVLLDKQTVSWGSRCVICPFIATSVSRLTG